MRYFTKDWYIGMQRETLHYFLVPDERAATFSEAFYQELYAEKLVERLGDARKLYELSGIETARKIYTPFVEAGEMEQQKLDALLEKLAQEERERPPFDEQAATRNFALSVENTIKRYEAHLPEEILSRVADMRILGLHVVTADVYERIKAYCEANERENKRVVNAYRAYFKSIWNELPKSIQELFNDLHDAKIGTVLREDDSLILHIVEGSFVQTIRFVDCEIDKLDDIAGAYWVYDELYFTDDGYEVGMLARMPSQQSDDLRDSLRELWLRARDIEVTQDEEALLAAEQWTNRMIEKGLARRIDANAFRKDERDA